MTVSFPGVSWPVVNVPSAVGRFLLLALLLITANPGVANCADPAAPALVSRLEVLNRGWEKLDAGENEQAAAFFRDRFRAFPGHLEIAEGLVVALLRQCEPDSALALLEDVSQSAGGAIGERLARFAAGARLKEQRRFAAGAIQFRQAAALCEEGGDLLSAAVATQEEGRCLLSERDLPAAETAHARLLKLLPETAGIERLQIEADVLLADVWNYSDRVAEADSLYEVILARATPRGFRQQRYDGLNGRGGLISKLRQIPAAQEFHHLALIEARAMGDRMRTALVLSNLGYNETHLRNLEQARSHLEEALELTRACGLVRFHGHIYVGLGAVAETAGRRQEAVDFFRQAYLSHRELGDEPGELGARQRLAYNLMMMGEYPEAVAHYERCLEILEALQSTYILNWVLGGLALTNHKLGYLERAEEYYRRTLEVNRQLGDMPSAAWCLNSIGMLHSLRGDYRRAVVRYNEAMDVFTEIGDRDGIGDSHVRLADVCLKLGDHDGALQHHQQAFAIAGETGYEELLRWAVAGLAEVHAAAGRQKAAGEYLRQALAIARRWDDSTAVIWALNELAAHCLKEDRPAEARELLAEAAVLQEDQGQYDLRSRTFLLLGRCAGSLADAVGHAERALALAREGCLPEREWNCLSDLGEYHLALGDTVRAGSLQLQAIESVESLRRAIGTDELRRHILRPTIVPYERKIALLLAGSRQETAAAEALAVSERSRAQILAGRLRAALARSAEQTVQEFTAEELDIQATIGYLQSRLQDGSLPPAERAELRARVDELEAEFRVLRIRMAGQDSLYAASAYPEAARADELLATLQPDERMLAYFLGSSRSYLFSAARDRVEAHVLPPRAEIEQKVQLFLRLQREAAVAQTGAGTPALPDSRDLPGGVLAAAQRELYDLLIGPAAADLEAGQRLIFVPDGLLHRLPFAGLRSERGYLLEEHELFLAPSLRTLRYLRSRGQARSQEGRRPGLDIIAVGCGNRPAAEQAGTERLHPYNGSLLAVLPEAELEARQVARLFSRAIWLAGEDAAESSLKSSPLATTDILHLAAHSYADDEDVRRSFVVLNRTPADREGQAAETEGAGPAGSGEGQPGPAEDGLLQWHEVAALPLEASLVTLASCHSAGGVLTYGEGITGLTQAFLYAGGTSVLAAQTDVPDRFSRRLMLEFYRHLREGDSAGEALRAAQLAALRCFPSDSVRHGQALT